MGQPYVGEIRMFGGNFAPVGWELCDGRLLPIDENETLFSLIGDTYGGDGQTTFAVPDLRGRVPLHTGTGPGLSSRSLAETGGVEQVTLAVAELPSHSHLPAGAGAPTTTSPAGAVWATWPHTPYASGSAATVEMNPAAVDPTGGGQPHDNLPPYLAVNFIISLFGLYPTT